MRPGIFVSRTREKLGHTCDQIGRTLEPCTLEAFGFIEDFVNKIKVLYNDTESVVKVNGGLSAPFKLTRGVRQGCPLSGMLYSVAIEPFLHKVRENINGLCLQSSSKNVSLSAYADDVVVLISDQKDIDTLVKFLNDFNPLVVFGLLSHLWCSRSKMTGLQTTAYKSVIMLYYH